METFNYGYSLEPTNIYKITGNNVKTDQLAFIVD